MEHELLVYRCILCKVRTEGESRHFCIDCERCEYSDHGILFADAVARAMMHGHQVAA